MGREQFGLRFVRALASLLRCEVRYSDNSQDIIPTALLLFRKGGILPLEEWGDAHVYDSKAGCGEMGPV